MIRVVGIEKNSLNTDYKIGSVIDTDDTLEAVKMFIEKLQDQDLKVDLSEIQIDKEVKYI